MRSSLLMSLSLCALSCSVAIAQPPGGREGRPPRDGERREADPRDAGPRDGGSREGGPREGGPRENGPRPHNPLMDVLDPDHDHVISAEEIKSAITALLKLDKNGDGKLTHDEYRPEHAGEGFGPPPREGGAGPGRPPREAGDRPRDHAPREGGPREEGRAGPPLGEGFGPPGGFGPPEGRGPGGPGGPGGPPDPARFIELVMEFDANKDGLMSKEELMKFAEQGMRRRGGPGGPGAGPGGPGGPSGGNRPGGDRGDQERPARPSRPGTE